MKPWERYAQQTPVSPAPIAGKPWEKFAQQPINPAAQAQVENPLMRTLGRAGRNVASGAGAMADVALLVPKTLAGGAALLTGNETLGKISTMPSMHDTVQKGIDQATGDTLKPTGEMDKAFDFGAEMLTGAGLSALPQKSATQAPGVIDAVRGVMNPAEAVANAMPQVPGQGSAASKVTSDQLRKQAGQEYKKAEEIGGALKPEFTNKFLDEIEKAKPQTMAGKLIAGDSPFTKLVDKLTGLPDETGNITGGIRNRPLTLDEAQEIDEYLSEAIDGFTEMGKLTKQGKKLYDIQSTLRDMIENADETLVAGGKEGFDTLSNARSLWAKSRRLADVERIIEKAGQMEVPATGIKTGFRTLYNNPNRIKGFTTEEREAIRKIAEGGPVNDFLKTMGSRLVAVGATIKGGPAGGAIGYGLSSASRGAANKLAMTKADKVADIIRGQTNAVSAPLSAKQKAMAAALANMTARGQ